MHLQEKDRMYQFHQWACEGDLQPRVENYDGTLTSLGATFCNQVSVVEVILNKTRHKCHFFSDNMYSINHAF